MLRLVNQSMPKTKTRAISRFTNRLLFLLSRTNKYKIAAAIYNAINGVLRKLAAIIPQPNNSELINTGRMLNAR